MDIKLEKDFFLSDVNGASALMDQPSTSSTSLVTQQLLAPSPFFAAVGAGLSAAAVPPSDFDLALGLLPTQQRLSTTGSTSLLLSCGFAAEDEPVQSFPPSSSLAPHEPCAVCGDTSDGHHYGVRSCRGCNAFFRRAVTLNLQFTCRRGGRCAVDKNVRCACRACRLQKCVAVGMDKRAVQPKKSVSGMGGGIEGTGSSFDEDHPMGGLTNGGGVGVSGTSRPDDAIVKTEPVIGGSRSAFKPIGAALTTESLMPAVVPSPPTGSGLITRLTFAYKEQLTKRRLMLCRTLDEAILPEGQVQLRGNAEGQDFVELFKVQAVLMFEWCESLEEFRAIKVPLDKTALLRWFVLKYIMLDNIFHTIRIGVTDRLVLVNNVWLSSIPMDPSHRQGEEEPQLTGEQEVQRRLHGEQTMALMEELVKPMAALKFRQGEEVAMRAIAFLNPHTKGLSEETQKIIKQGSERVMNELERYWEETQSISATEARSRLVNLLLLMPSLDKHVLAQKDTLKLIPGFGDTHRWDDYIGDLIRD